MEKRNHHPGDGAHRDNAQVRVKPLSRGYGDEHGGYVVDAEAEHTVVDPDIISPAGTGQSAIHESARPPQTRPATKP